MSSGIEFQDAPPGYKNLMPFQEAKCPRCGSGMMETTLKKGTRVWECTEFYCRWMIKQEGYSPTSYTVTDKQIRFAFHLWQETGHKFIGHTKEDASKWIDSILRMMNK